MFLFLILHNLSISEKHKLISGAARPNEARLSEISTCVEMSRQEFETSRDSGATRQEKCLYWNVSRTPQTLSPK